MVESGSETEAEAKAALPERTGLRSGLGHTATCPLSLRRSAEFRGGCGTAEQLCLLRAAESHVRLIRTWAINPTVCQGSGSSDHS